MICFLPFWLHLVLDWNVLLRIYVYEIHKVGPN